MSFEKMSSGRGTDTNKPFAEAIRLLQVTSAETATVPSNTNGELAPKPTTDLDGILARAKQKREAQPKLPIGVNDTVLVTRSNGGVFKATVKSMVGGVFGIVWEENGVMIEDAVSEDRLLLDKKFVVTPEVVFSRFHAGDRVRIPRSDGTRSEVTITTVGMVGGAAASDNRNVVLSWNEPGDERLRTKRFALDEIENIPASTQSAVVENTIPVVTENVIESPAEPAYEVVTPIVEVAEEVVLPEMVVVDESAGLRLRTVAERDMFYKKVWNEIQNVQAHVEAHLPKFNSETDDAAAWAQADESKRPPRKIGRQAAATARMFYSGQLTAQLRRLDRAVADPTLQVDFAQFETEIAQTHKIIAEQIQKAENAIAAEAAAQDAVPVIESVTEEANVPAVEVAVESVAETPVATEESAVTREAVPSPLVLIQTYSVKIEEVSREVNEQLAKFGPGHIGAEKRQTLIATLDRLARLRERLLERANESDQKVLAQMVKKTVAWINQDIETVRTLVQEVEVVAKEAGEAPVAATEAAATITAAEETISAPAEPFISTPEMRVKRDVVPTGLELPTESFDGPVVTTFAQEGETFLSEQAGGGALGVKLEFPALVTPVTPEIRTEDQVLSLAANELKNIHAIPFVSVAELATAEAMFRNVAALKSEGKSAEVLAKVVLSLHDYGESLTSQADPLMLVARAENVIREMNSTEVPERNTQTIRSLAEGVLRIAAEETAAGTDGARTVRAYELLMAMIKDDAEHSTVMSENVPSAGAYETPEVVRTSETPKPLEVGFETLRDARVAYRDALLRAVSFKDSKEAAKQGMSAAEFADYTKEIKADVEGARSLYYTVFEDVSSESVSSRSEKAEIGALEDALQNEKSKIAALAKKFATWAVPLTAGFLAFAEPAADGTRVIEQIDSRGPYTQADVPTAPAAPVAMAFETKPNITVTADAPVEIVEGVVLPEPSASDSEPKVDLTPSQPPVASGITFSYPTAEASEPVVPRTETPRAQTSVTAETTVGSVTIPSGWGENNPGVEFTTPEQVTANAVHLGERDISPKLDLEPLPTTHAFTHGEGLWDVVMGTTEISDLASLKGESYEFRRDTWKKINEKAIADESFRTSLGDVRLADNGQPWIFGTLNLDTLNSFIQSEKAAANQPEKVSERVQEQLAPQAEAAVILPEIPAVAPENFVESAPQVSLADAWNYVDKFPGGKAALGDEIARFVQKVEGVFSVPKKGFSLLHMFDHQFVDPYEALAPVTLRDLRTVVQLKDSQAVSQKLAEWNITPEGFGVWAKYLQKIMVPGHPLYEVADSLTLGEVTPLIFATDRLGQSSSQ